MSSNLLAAALLVAGGGKGAPADDVRLMVLEPGHFHAALLQKERPPGVSRQASIYAALGPDLTAHLNRILRFNTRPQNPTDWELRVYAGPDPLGHMLAERPGNVVVLSGRNNGKIDAILASVSAGLHVLADKPWIIDFTDFPKLEAALAAASKQGVVAYDGMTQRFEISCILQKELVQDPNVFGHPLEGTRDNPGLYMESVHYMLKTVAGVPNQRPAWFFDIRQQGEGLADVGTHLVDLVQWTLFPNVAPDWQKDVEIVGAHRWPTLLSLPDFQRVTGEAQFPSFLAVDVADERLRYFCNNSVSYRLRGIHVKLDVKWEFEPAPGANDTELAIARGSRSRVEVRQGREQDYRPEVLVIPNEAAGKPAIEQALRQKLAALAAAYPGLAFDDLGDCFRLRIPDRYRIGHEAHFALLAAKFFQYRRTPGSLPAWEAPNMLVKYYVTTKGVDLARRSARPEGAVP